MMQNCWIIKNRDKQQSDQSVLKKPHNQITRKLSTSLSFRRNLNNILHFFSVLINLFTGYIATQTNYYCLKSP